jgi:hypothetical protein
MSDTEEEQNLSDYFDSDDEYMQPVVQPVVQPGVQPAMQPVVQQSDDNIEQALILSRELYEMELAQKKSNGLELSLNILPFEFCEELKETYPDNEKYNSNSIIIPPRIFQQIIKYQQEIFSNNESSLESALLKPITLKIDNMNLYLVVSGSYDDDFAYVPTQIYHTYFSKDDTIICTYKPDIADKVEKIILEPLSNIFLDIKDLSQLFENNIGRIIRFIQKDQIIKSNNEDLSFKINMIISNDEEVDIGYCIDGDVIIDFYIPDDILKRWTIEINELREKRQKTLASLQGLAISTRTTEKKELSKDELRQQRLQFYKK